MKLVCILAAITLLSACGGSSSGSSDSGIRGRAVISPACPVEPCTIAEPPYEGTFVVRNGDNVIATVNTGADGRFEVRLAPGAYVLQSDVEAEALPLLKPVEVPVREHEFTNVTLAFDSGIR
jgi:hypothetical protein